MNRYIDMGLANQAWKELFPGPEVRVLDVTTSDHLSLYFHVNRKIRMQKEKRLWFENTWIKRSECLKLIRGCWNEEVNNDIMTKLSLWCDKLKEWGGGLVQKMRKNL